MDEEARERIADYVKPLAVGLDGVTYYGDVARIVAASEKIAASRDAALWRGLGRLERGPRTPEEEVVHDAVRLEELGAYGVSRKLLEGYRERLDFAEIAQSIEDSGQEPLSTAVGRALAGPRIEAMREFARRLREEYEEFSPQTIERPPSTRRT